ncbi:hypothetical protein FHR32_002974 [Streptosporangium album]|uniref:Chaplin domain-containing protein n=1 Tax=Streptosporangium album TaxID=47479 RepID=A0A7W7WA17_9ACTN|nr:chaplin family protein [Streptosporangium album]MBB4938669.1 hypothetical protein [Streptosporangium album]
MRTWVKGTAPAALLALGVMALGSGTALADTSGDGSIGGGNQLNLPITLPIDISGNAVAVAGESAASSQGGASVENLGGGGIPGETSGRGSILGGNQVTAPITAPVNACGNALSVFGRSQAGCKGGASVRNGGRGGAGGNRTDGDHSILGGNQIVAPITAPVNACGNAVAVFGDAVAGCEGGASVRNGGRGGAGGNTTSGRGSILGGNQIVAPITAPINVCGNSVAVLGGAFSGCKGGAEVTDGGGPGWPGGPGCPGHPGRPCGPGGPGGHGGKGYLGGQGGQGGPGWNGGGGWNGGPGRKGSTGNDTDGRFGAGSGNQIVAPITAPVNVCGNAVAVLGGAFAGCKGGASVKNGGRGGVGGNTTSGRGSILGGNQIVAPITAPVNVCGNAVAVLGDAAAGCLGGSYVGEPGGGHRGHWARMATHKNSGLVPALPAMPALGGAMPGTAAQDSGLPVAGAMRDMAGLPELPVTPGTQAGAQQAGSPMAPVTGLVSSTPLGGALPVSGLGLMSAAQPVGVTGMNSGSLAALLLGALAAASATLFVATRRLRFGKK